MTAWSRVRLGDICEFKYGKALPAAARTGGPVPVYGSNGIVGWHSEALTSGNAIIIGRKGSLGRIAYSQAPCWPIDTTFYVEADTTSANLKWLAYQMESLNLTSLSRAAAVPGLNREDAYRQTLLLPRYPDQCRIAAILDHADALRAKRRQIISHLDTLTQSIFHDMFGRSSPTSTVAEIAGQKKGSIRTGPFGSQLRHTEFVDTGVAVLGLDNVVSNRFQWARRRFITAEKYVQLRRYTVAPGDVLISIMGTTGKCVVVPNNIPVAITTKHLCAISLDPLKVRPEFLRAVFLWHPDSRAYLNRQTKGSIMDGLNMGIIKGMPVPVPPLDMQDLFTKRIDELRSQASRVSEHVHELEHLFASLQSRAFKGKL